MQNETDWMLQQNMARIKNKIIVMSGKGGVGKSTVSVNLAYGLVLQGFRVGLLDVDIHGPSIARMTGIEGERLYENENGLVTPIEAVHNLFVLTIASMLENSDEPIIWRGPAKIGAIKQFLSEIHWPDLDYLIIDCPPGTGDEPLSVIQLIGNQNISGSVIVSTPQEVSLLDVRKSIKFCEKLSVPILGIIENMSGFICPKCGERFDIFKSGGVMKTSKDFNIDILGHIPIDPNIVHSTDDGKPYIYNYAKTDGGKEFQKIIDKIVEKLSVKKE
ncbi:MAG TPA: Mrp/NBP35 family ATP-binding protein [Spirochaetota bacterium]|nr:Mrp/NBP35 family ATP-binding protein [Spirochaetota bacterium]HOL56070.1 Mrp/NBP35 family ATP-binding protein [Spirochaetota bacterium]HPP03216.1 Mrp/NBP35 family ATP-binding protein [Spirochaetota bacterium]